MTLSSSSPVRPEKSRTLIRLSSRSSPFSINCEIASTTAGSAVCLRTENWAWVSLMLEPR